MIDARDNDSLTKEKIVQKLLRIEPVAADGFILDDFPKNLKQAESLEEMDGGMNAFVHVSMPERFLAKMEEVKHKCTDCGAIYYNKDIED